MRPGPISYSQEKRRATLEKPLAGATGPMHLTPATRERALARDWLRRFEGARLDGVIAKVGATALAPAMAAADT